MKVLAISILTLVAGPLALAAPDMAALGRQCRSVHLGYQQIPKARAAYIEVVPESSANGTYFCALGFDMGYCGIQEKADGSKVAIFSVWEPGDPFDSKSRPDKVPEDKRVGLLEQGENVKIGRFGGEGTGGQSFLALDWKIGQPVRFFVQAKPVGEFTEFAVHVANGPEDSWHFIACFRTHSKGIPLQGMYSFVEDFRRNGESAKQMRRATYQNGWVLSTDQQWKRMATARFTADNNPDEHVDAGAVKNGFFLQTGGDTTQKTNKLWNTMVRPDAGPSQPEGLDKLLRP